MKDKIKNIIEAILFVAGDQISIKFLAETLNISQEEIRLILYELKETKYNESSSGIVLTVSGDSIAFTTNPKFYNEISEYFNYDKMKNLTNAALEVLSIIAYKQPVTKAEIDRIRGVKSDHIISKLVNDDFIFVSDKLDAPGLPNLYSTTDKFLLKFNLESIEDLPNIEIEGVEIWDYRNI